MIQATLLLLLVLLLSSAIAAQKPNSTISAQIKELKAERSIALDFDAAGGTTKILAKAESFDGKEAGRAGILAMSFAMAVVYGSTVLAAPAESINFTFWVLTKKPQFAAANDWKLYLSSGYLDLGNARYAARPSENMEYLNFKISREDLAKIAGRDKLKFRLGNSDFTFTPEQTRLLRNFLAITNVQQPSVKL